MFAVLVFKAAKLAAFGLVKSSLGKGFLLGYGSRNRSPHSTASCSSA